MVGYTYCYKIEIGGNAWEKAIFTDKDACFS